MTRTLLLFFFLILPSQTIARQDMHSAVTALFSEIKEDEPGYAVGIVENGDLIYSRGFGAASLEYQIPITDSTVFYIGSVAKQFTAAAIVQLREKGLLLFDDPVSTYFPEMANYDQVVTIDHLLHHTGGVRGTNSLQLFQGINTNFEEFFDTDDLVELILDQKALNFEPGSEYRYSSGGYAILAKIVEQVSGMSFREYMREYIFEPLGMRNTMILDDHTEVIRNLATSYWPDDTGFEKRSLLFEAYGDGGLVTTVKDLAAWDAAFYDDILGVVNFSGKMYEQGRLNNGELIPYASAVEVREYKNRRVILHGGGMLGYRADIVRFPDDSLSVIVLSNTAYADPIGKAFQIADLFPAEPVSKNEQTPSSQAGPKEEPDVFTITDPDVWEGKYFSEDINQWRRITLSGDSLFLDSGDLNWKSYLKPVGDSLFYPTGYMEEARIRFKEEAAGKKIIYTEPTVTRIYEHFDDTPPSGIAELEWFTGEFRSEELEVSYHFTIRNERFLMRIGRNDWVELFPDPVDGRINWNSKNKVWIGFGMITFLKDNSGKVTGLEIGDYRVSGVRFIKVN